MYCYTEVSFPTVNPVDMDKEKSRFDGLAIVVGGNKIKDACIFEMKYGNAKIEGEQIEKYIKMALQLGIDKIVSISNQFVTNPTDYPVSVKVDKKWKGQLYHLSWSYVVYFADILLQKNGTDIADVDQHNIMNEVKEYLNHCGGVNDFDSMKTFSKGVWGDVVRDLASVGVLKKDFEEDRKEIVRSWIQEEKDLSLKLSKRLSGKKATAVKIKTKYKQLSERIENETKQLKDTRSLFSIFDIEDAVSPLKIMVNFNSKQIITSMMISVPSDKTSKGKIGFIRKYIKKAQERNYEGKFNRIQDNSECVIIPKVKTKNKDVEKYSIKKILDDAIEIPKYDFNTVEIIMTYELEKNIYSQNKFIKELEDNVLDYYSVLMQYFEKWTPSTPKTDDKTSIKEKKESFDEILDEQKDNKSSI